ncbi:STAS domain-containing protein [Sporosarcina sp. OR05]|uniref:STAS domain-containing protein n=1 Tax=Sporosarcina sp. OR05 TaxID=2969819 RepID=UPI00352B38BF
MSENTQKLFDFLHAHINGITDEWLAARKPIKGSIYSKDAGDETEEMLREQNKWTNITIASSLLTSRETFDENKKSWAIHVAHSRVISRTPIYEVQEALSKVRHIFWNYVNEFVDREGEQILRSDIMYWSNAINLAFDELMIEFSKKYDELMHTRLTAQQSLIEELNAPVIKLTNRIGVLPIIGDVDTTRVQSILDYVPRKCVELDVEHLYIDLSGVTLIDTMVANHIYQLTQIVDLLGIESTLTGIRPEIAQTSVQLGLDFTAIQTYSSLQQALQIQV